jgi:NADH:ubiquinone oxidoreductase subunit 6 (subunit J)
MTWEGLLLQHLFWVVPVGLIAVHFLIVLAICSATTPARRRRYLREFVRGVPISLLQVGLGLVWVAALIAVGGRTPDALRLVIIGCISVISLWVIAPFHFHSEDTFGRLLWRLALPLVATTLYLSGIIQLLVGAP